MARLAGGPSGSSGGGAGSRSVRYYERRVPRWKYPLFVALLVIISYCIYRLLR
jgi:hypothetical protein